MKKLLLGIGLSLAVLSAQAAQWQTYSLFAGGITSVTVSNALATGNGGGLTNLLSRGLQTTNVAGVIFTNNGTQVTVATNTGFASWNGTDINLFADYWPMPTHADGSPPYQSTSNYLTGVFYPSDFSLNLKLTGGSGANSAVTLTFVPLVGKGADAELEEGECWNVAFTATTTTMYQCHTNIPLYRWPGVAGLRLKRIVNGDADASSQVVITDLTINGPRP